MNILNISTYDYGGAGSAVLRINETLISLNNTSKVIVFNKKSKDQNVIQLTDGNFNLFLKKIYRKVYHELQKSFVFKFVKKYNFFNYSEQSRYIKPIVILNKLDFTPEIIIVHYTSHFINFKTIYELQQLTKARIIFNMLDTAFLTGGCHYSWNCLGFHNKCSDCSALLIQKDMSIKNHSFKSHYLNKMHSVKLVASSSWAINQAKKSSLFKNFEKELIYYPIDQNIFKPKKVNFSNSKKNIFFGTQDFKILGKGVIYFEKALVELEIILQKKQMNNIEIRIVGGGESKLKISSSFKVNYLGKLPMAKLIDEYSKADVFVCSSIEDNGPMMINEALMCGSPVVCFDVGIGPDLVNNSTGYLAQNFSYKDLAKGIYKVLFDSDLEKLKNESRNTAINKYGNTIVKNSWERLINNI
jgi:glycosyltransferase involved in cell wall biosynthesis